MWKTLKIGGQTLTRLDFLKNFNRTFLSEAYRCTEAWNRRLESPLLSKVKAHDMFYELDRKFQNAGKASAIDVDIYANVVRGPDHVEELIDILYKLRLTPEASNILDSTHHAVIRYFFDINEVNDLLTILHDRINYGIFPDYLCYNILMDSFVEKGDFASAAKVAVLLMLQEDSTHVISSALAMYSCYKYLEKPEDWPAPEPEPQEDPKSPEVKVRVRFIRKPYFDDHFDLRDPADLVGKTLVFFGKTMDDVLGRSSHLRGLVLWKKYQDAANLMKKWTEAGQKECIYAEVLDQLREHISCIPEDKITGEIKELKELVEGFNRNMLKEGNVIEDIEKRVHEAVKVQEEVDISEAHKMYEEWNKKRVSLLESELAELDRKERLEKVEEMKQELKKRERLLTFFENQEKIELQIQEKQKKENLLYGKRSKKSVGHDENYIPPEIVKKRN